MHIKMIIEQSMAVSAPFLINKPPVSPATEYQREEGFYFIFSAVKNYMRSPFTFYALEMSLERGIFFSSFIWGRGMSSRLIY